MEGHAGSLATGAGTSAALAAFSGFNTIAMIVAALTLLWPCSSWCPVSAAKTDPQHEPRSRHRPVSRS